jgi:hypothetical protein
MADVIGTGLANFTMYASSLGGQRSVESIFSLLDNVLSSVSSLERVTDATAEPAVEDGVPMDITDQMPGPSASTLIYRSTLGNVGPGKYFVHPEDKSWYVIPLKTFRDAEMAERGKEDKTTRNIGTNVSKRDDAEDEGFKERLKIRDRGCAVCFAQGLPNARYEYAGDGEFFRGGHIWPLSCHQLWAKRNCASYISDPFTDPSSQPVSSTTPLASHSGRMNSLENGIMLCLFHHKAYDTFRYSIHPKTHRIYAFHPTVTHLHDLEIIAPWKKQHPKYPPPLDLFLNAHFESSVAWWMKAGAEEYLDSDNSDEEELSELQASVGSNEACADSGTEQ